MWRGGGGVEAAEAAEAAEAVAAAEAAAGVAVDRLRLLTLRGGHKFRSTASVHY